LLQTLFQPNAIAGILAGFLLAGVPAILVWIRSRQVRARMLRRQAELAPAHRRNHAIVEAFGEGVLELDSAGRVRYANPAAAQLLGYLPEELPGLDYKVLINTGDGGDSGDTPEVPRRVRYTTDIKRGVGALLRRKDGQRRPVEYKIVPVTEESAYVGTVLTFRDVSERVRLDSLLRDMQNTAKVGGWEYNVGERRVHWTDVVYNIFDLPLGERVDLALIKSYLLEEDLEPLARAVKTLIETGLGVDASGKTVDRVDMQLRLQGKRGRLRWVRVIAKAERRAEITVRLHGMIQDITDRVIAERQVRETRDFYDLTLNAMPTMVMYTDKNGVVTYVNKAMGEWFRLPRAECVGRHLVEIMSQPAYAAIADHVSAALQGETGSLTHSSTHNGVARDWLTHFVPEFAPDPAPGTRGEVRGFFSIYYDLTKVKRLQADLLQAQKMETVGQLTGGIAHDFNNLLGVVLGNLQLIERSVADNAGLARKVHTAMRAAVRGADMTRRLLTFARRQILDPNVLDLNRQLSGVADLMQRTLGESIEARIVQMPDLWHTRVDAGQFENAILNLAINARDAMPNGGRLVVKTQNVRLDSVFAAAHPPLEPGEYVSVSVTDNGVGIEPDVLARVFEPFFTTKESGRGSGLGLAMVHGFAEQSGGLATINSEVGRGTTVQILLPRCAEEQSLREDTIVTKIAPTGDETILVVEDDADLRETAVTALKQFGYQALDAPKAEDALRILMGPEHIDLLFTDVMMPGGTLGPELAKRARELRPGIKVLFTTGYAATSVLSGASVSSADVVHKPYRNEELAVRVRTVLDRREAHVA